MNFKNIFLFSGLSEEELNEIEKFTIVKKLKKMK